MKATRNRQEPFVYGSLGGGTVGRKNSIRGVMRPLVIVMLVNVIDF
jgi:hypothetical protein